MHVLRYWLLLGALAACLALPALGADAGQAAGRRGISIAETGKDSEGRPLFSVLADSAEVTDLLKALFTKTGDEFTIDQDVSGPIDLNIRDKTLEDLFQEIARTFHPALKIRKDGKVWRVSRGFDAQAAAEAIRNRMEGNGRFEGALQTPNGVMPRSGKNLLSTAVPLGETIPTNRYVSLDVPDARPIALSDALAQISAQTGFPVSLDKRVPRDLRFSGVIVRASLPLVLQEIARTSGLKLIADGTQAVLAPTDQFSITFNGLQIGQMTAFTCRRCGHSISPLWNFCPNCGLPTPRGTQQQYQQNQAPGSRAGVGSRGTVQKFQRP